MNLRCTHKLSARSSVAGKLAIAGTDPKKPRHRALLAALLLSTGSSLSAANVLYVNISAPPGGNGSSWASAFSALDAALLTSQSGDQVWVAAGTYITPPPAPSLSSFIVPSGVSLYGGFGGTETSVDQAQPSIHVTILKGLTQVDPASGGPVLVLSNSISSIISGFTIRDGFAADVNAASRGGGGVLIQGGNVTLMNCVLTHNTTFSHPDRKFGRGGALCAQSGSTVTISDCLFDANTTHGWPAPDLVFYPPSPGHGGAVYSQDSTLIISNSTFTNNASGSTATGCAAGALVAAGDGASGGAIYSINSAVTIKECSFNGNKAGSSRGDACSFMDPLFPEVPVGGFAGDGGAVCLIGGSAGVSRCVFVNNAAGKSDAGSGSGGAIFANGPLFVCNSRFLGNRAGAGMEAGDAGDGGGVAAWQSLTLSNCDLIGNAAGDSDQAGLPIGIDGVGGAVYAAGTSRISNCTVAMNAARGQAAGLFKANLENCIVYSNNSTLLGQALDAQMVGGSAVYSVVQGWIPNVLLDPYFRNSAADPRFVDLAGVDQIPGTMDDDPRVKENSPAIDSGNNLRQVSDALDLNNNGNISEWIPFDLAGSPRMLNDPNVPDTGFPGAAPTVDRGAYEFVLLTCQGDLNLDGQVDDADFVVFAAAYNLLDCTDPAMPFGCPADLNHDGGVDDADFVIFAAAYNKLVCL